MKGFVVVALLLALAPLQALGSQEESGIEVAEFAFCSGIDEMAPVEAKSQFFSSMDRIYCFTRIDGASDTTSVFHVWYHGEEEMARVELPVKSGSWRTWSSKRMMDSWDGTWKVEVLDSDGKAVAKKEFVYKPLGKEGS